MMIMSMRNIVILFHLFINFYWLARNYFGYHLLWNLKTRILTELNNHKYIFLPLYGSIINYVLVWDT